MFYLTKFHDNRVNTFGFMEAGFWSPPPPPPPPQAQELQKSPGGLGLSSIMFSSLYSSVLFQYDRTRFLLTTPVTFYERGDLNELNVDLLARGKIQDGGEFLYDLFSLKSFCICAKKEQKKNKKKPQKINELIKPLHCPKEHSSWNLFCHRNTPENATNFRSWS